MSTIHHETSDGEDSFLDEMATSSGDEAPVSLAEIQRLASAIHSKKGEAEKKAKKAKKGKKRSAEALETVPDDGLPRVVYLGHIPHGFYEKQMKGFFSQFGEVTRLRLSRNKKTGHSKHYAFIEFKYPEVAKIVSETMNGYYLAGKTLVCSIVPPDKLHKDTFKGANKVPNTRKPWRTIARAKEAKSQTDESRKRAFTRLMSNEAKKRQRIAEMGMDYEFSGYKGVVEAAKQQSAGAQKGTTAKPSSTPAAAPATPVSGKKASAKTAATPVSSKKAPASMKKATPAKGTPAKGTPAKGTSTKGTPAKGANGATPGRKATTTPRSTQKKKVTPKRGTPKMK